jgi:type VII secretion protein EccB
MGSIRLPGGCWRRLDSGGVPMPSRQDQLHAHQFTVQRVVAALVMRETDPAQSPMRRIAGATWVGAFVAVMALAGAAVYGLLVGGTSTDWRDPHVVIIEKESGARYVYRDGLLHPVLNYASALLIVGSDGARTVPVSRRSLADAPRGAALGIPGAPDSLPAKDRLLASPWQVCSRNATDATAAGRPQSVLRIGAGSGTGRGLDDAALLVSIADGEQYLVWHSHRYRIRDAPTVMAAFGWDRQVPSPTGARLRPRWPARRWVGCTWWTVRAALGSTRWPSPTGWHR